MGVSLGVDWGGDHWLCLEHQPNSAAPHPATYNSIKDVWEAYDDGHNISRLCIDIPIGLPTGPDERAVDKQCRSYLARKSTVFRVPIREALEADTPEEVNRKSREGTQTEDTDGVGVQPPAYAIRKQILEVNKFVNEHVQDTTDKLYEVHPELCFKMLSGSPPQYKKTTAHGAAERIEALDTVADDDLGSPALAAAVGAALDGSETMAARPVSRPETILATMFERNSEHLYVKDTDRHYLLLNDSSYAPPELLGRRDEDGLPAGAAYLEAARGDDLQVIDDGTDVLDVHEFAPSMERHLRTSKVPWYDETGDLAGLVGITQDITDQRERERLLRQQNERLRKVALLAAHELRNELQVSTGHLSQIDVDDEHSGTGMEKLQQRRGEMVCAHGLPAGPCRGAS